MYETLEIEREAGIVTLWMNRPQVHNAFNAELIAELTMACERLDGEEDARVVVLAGRGKSFSAGADVNWMKTAGAATLETNVEDARALARMLRALAELGKPTIARVHGAALGGGMGLACACDVCVASAQAHFATTEVRLGLVPATIGPYVLRAIGERQCYRYFLTGERMDAARARELGLVHELAASEALDAAVRTVAEALLAGGPRALAEAKALIRALAQQPIADAVVEDSVRRIAALRASAEAREGLAAFLEKRPPRWSPRT